MNETKVTIQIEAVEALQTYVPALLRKQDEPSHKLAQLIIDALAKRLENNN